VITCIDVTERLEAETQSRRLAAVLRDSSDAIALIDLDGRITAWNRGAEAMYGYTEADAVTMSLYDLVTEEGREHTRDIITRVAQGEVLPAFEAQRRTRDGRVIDVRATVTLLRDASDNPASFATTERDVTVERRSTRQMRAILDATPDAVVTIDQSGKIVTFNQSAVRLFGYRADEVIGQSVGLLMPPRESLRHGEYLDRYHRTHERHVIGTPREVNACRKDGTLFPVSLSVIEIEHLGLFAGFVHDMTATKTLREEVLKIAILEQQRIGQELHDGTQQELTGLGLLAHELSEALTRQGSHTEAKLAARLASGIAQANLHVRSLAHGLVPVPVDAETLPAALGELARSTRATYGLSCQFDCPEPVQVGTASTATHLYRIAQEAVGNAAKHAKADAISIRLTRTEADLVLEIADNGTGIAPGRPPHEGAGLRLMEYRCAVIGGRFTVQQQEGGGTLVTCAIPLSGRS
jgi:two-component system sensor kinase FixL